MPNKHMETLISITVKENSSSGQIPPSSYKTSKVTHIHTQRQKTRYWNMATYKLWWIGIIILRGNLSICIRSFKIFILFDLIIRLLKMYS